MPVNLENSAVATGLKRLVFIPIPKKDKAEECSNYHTIALISHASKVMLEILQTRLQHYVKREHPDVQAGFIKDRGSRNKIANIIKAAGEFQKNIYYCFPDYAKASCLTLSDPMDCSLPGSSTHGICQARVLEWVAIAFSKQPLPFLPVVGFLSISVLISSDPSPRHHTLLYPLRQSP